MIKRIVEKSASDLQEATTNSVTQIAGINDRKLVLIYPLQLISRIMKGGSFRNEECRKWPLKHIFRNPGCPPGNKEEK